MRVSTVCRKTVAGLMVQNGLWSLQDIGIALEQEHNQRIRASLSLGCIRACVPACLTIRWVLSETVLNADQQASPTQE